jgi:hypothetical protein
MLPNVGKLDLSEPLPAESLIRLRRAAAGSPKAQVKLLLPTVCEVNLGLVLDLHHLIGWHL